MKRTLGTSLRHLIDLLDGDVDQAYRDAGLDYRPRFTPVMRALRDGGPAPIKHLARAAGVTHSALSQTIADMKAADLVVVTTGVDARERSVALTRKARETLPRLEAQWRATEEAAQGLDREIKTSLAKTIEDAIAALERRPFRERIASHLPTAPRKRPATRGSQ
jgi:DNA-binding MarR family transcriptional regulator